MDKYKFRGKRIEDGKWVYGSYQADVLCENKHTIIYCDNEGFYCEDEVDPKTVGQFIRRYDTKKNPFYEGDIYEYDNDSYYYGRTDRLPVCIAVIYNIEDLYANGNSDLLDFHLAYEPKIIGNVHDNPELIENKRRMCGLKD
jgi:predicted RNase H-like HicB family nuclease